MKKTFRDYRLISLLFALVTTSAAGSLSAAGPRMGSLTFEAKAPNICFRLSNTQKNRIKLLGIEFLDKSTQQTAWKVQLLESGALVSEEQCVAYGQEFAGGDVIRSPAKLVFGHVYEASVTGDLVGAESESYRPYVGAFCITKSEAGRPITHTLTGENGSHCPAQ